MDKTPRDKNGKEIKEGSIVRVEINISPKKITIQDKEFFIRQTTKTILYGKVIYTGFGRSYVETPEGGFLVENTKIEVVI